MALRPPAKFEYALLQFLAQHQGLSVRDLFEQFGKPQGYIRGTIVKSMDRMLKKGLVERNLVDGAYLYRTKQQAEVLEMQQVESFIKDRLGGRLQPIASFLASSEKLTAVEAKHLEELLSKLES